MMNIHYSRVQSSATNHNLTRVLKSNINRFCNYVVVGDDNLYERIEMAAGKKVLYFTAVWCPPCRKIGPIFETLSKDHSKISFYKIDVDQVANAAAKNNIRGVPTFQFRSGPKLVNEFTGADEAALKRAILDLESLA